MRVVRLDRAVYVGAFKLNLGAATLTPSVFALGRPMVTIDFEAENLTTYSRAPFDSPTDEELLLEVGGASLFGEAAAAKIPGLRKGKGTLTWQLPSAAAGLALPTATLTIGNAAQNAVVVPFAKVGETVSLADRPVQASFTSPPHQNATVTLRRAYVTYQDRSRNGNGILSKGKAHLVLDVTIEAVPNLSASNNFQDDDTALLRPDGVSVVTWINEIISSGYRQDLTLPYEITEPVSGTYTLTIGWGKSASHHTLVVP